MLGFYYSTDKSIYAFMFIVTVSARRCWSCSSTNHNSLGCMSSTHFPPPNVYSVTHPINPTNVQCSVSKYVSFHSSSSFQASSHNDAQGIFTKKNLFIVRSAILFYHGDILLSLTLQNAESLNTTQEAIVDGRNNDELKHCRQHHHLFIRCYGNAWQRTCRVTTMAIKMGRLQDARQATTGWTSTTATLLATENLTGIQLSRWCQGVW